MAAAIFAALTRTEPGSSSSSWKTLGAVCNGRFAAGRRSAGRELRPGMSAVIKPDGNVERGIGIYPRGTRNTLMRVSGSGGFRQARRGLCRDLH